MNRLNYFDGRFALFSSFLLLAMWAPLTTFGQANEPTIFGEHATTSAVYKCAHCETLHLTKGPPCPHQRAQHFHLSDIDDDAAVGFSETDPTAYYFQDFTKAPEASDYKVAQDYVGFAEADPTNSGVLTESTSFHAGIQSLLDDPAGFGENDPAQFPERANVFPVPTLVACQHMGVSQVFPSVTGSTGQDQSGERAELEKFGS